jgi:nucleotide-binding universal stress UspA family protein
MAFKDVVAVLGAETDRAGEYAISLARELGVHLTAVALVLEGSLPGYAMAVMPYDVLASARRDAEAAASRLLADFRTNARARGAEAEVLTVAAPRDQVDYHLALLARHFDLTILGQGAPHERATGNLFIEAALFGSGRPILVVPYIHEGAAKLGRIVIAWDGSRAAARAVADALPLMTRAARVELVTVEDGAEVPEHAEVNMTRHLARHGVHAAERPLTSAGDVANTILSHLADTGADLLVMGGYGHSRFREMVLGGATRDILASMTVPVLMSH